MHPRPPIVQFRRVAAQGLGEDEAAGDAFVPVEEHRITSYNVCYTKLLRCLLLAMSLGPVLDWPLWTRAMLVMVAPLLWALWRTERRQAWPLLPPSLLALGSMRFGLALALVFFGSWSGFMFVVALTLQIGVGMSPALSGQAFIALGAAFFLMALSSGQVVRRIGNLPSVLVGFSLQIPGLLGLIHVMDAHWPAVGVLTLVAPSVFIGAGQALIVSRITSYNVCYTKLLRSILI